MLTYDWDSTSNIILYYIAIIFRAQCTQFDSYEFNSDTDKAQQASYLTSSYKQHIINRNNVLPIDSLSMSHKAHPTLNLYLYLVINLCV